MSQPSADETQFQDTPSDWAQRLTREFGVAREALKEWHSQAEEAIAAYTNTKDVNRGDRLPVFTADTQTQEAILYGNPPKADVSRRFADAQDDVGRVAGEIQERLLNEDVEGKDDTFAQAVELAHWERQVPGLGMLRHRYEMGELPPVAEGQPPVDARPNEAVETDWVHWKDVLWNSCRVWHEVEWLAFGNDVSRSEAAKRFGEDVAGRLPVNGKPKSSETEIKVSNPWDRIRIHEVWVKSVRQVFFLCEGYSEVLKPVAKDVQVETSGGVKDPLGLEGFFPCPRPLFANLTTSKLVPKPDYELNKPLYEEVNELRRRIRLIEKSIAVRGTYDEANVGLKQLLSDACENFLLPVKNWNAFVEKGGIAGAVSYDPLDIRIQALQILTGRLNEKLDLLRQMTGMADIMRGQASEPGATATEQRIKARFGSVRMEKRQKELARFCSDAQRIRAEIMAKHFHPTTYLARCNLEGTADAQLAPKAAALLQSSLAKYRIEVKPETVAMTDFDALKQERTEVIGAVSQYITAVAPMAQNMPGSLPYLLQVLQWMVAGLRGSAEIEGVLDAAIAAAKQTADAMQQNPQQQPPDPKVLAQQLKGQQDLQKIQAETQADLVRTQAEVAADAQREENQAIWNVKEATAKHALILNNPRPDTRPPVGHL